MAQPANPLKVHLCKSNKGQSSYIYVVHVLVLLFFCENTQCEKGLELEMTKKKIRNLGKPPHKNLFKMSFWKLLKYMQWQPLVPPHFSFQFSRHFLAYCALFFCKNTGWTITLDWHATPLCHYRKEVWSTPCNS